MGRQSIRSLLIWTIAGILLTTVLALITFNVWLTSQLVEQREQTSLERNFWIVCQDSSSSQARAEAFLELVEGGHSEWRSARLERLELQGAQLVGRNLAWSNLQYSKMSESNLAGADLTNAILQAVDFRSADLQQAQLVGADLLKADLSKVQARQAKFTGGSMDQATARSAIFVLCDFSDAHLQMGDFTGSDFTGADLRGANLEAAILRDCNLGLAKLDDALLADADFQNANWWRARGLSSEQVSELKRKFAPDSGATESVRLDYDKWLGR